MRLRALASVSMVVELGEFKIFTKLLPVLACPTKTGVVSIIAIIAPKKQKVLRQAISSRLLVHKIAFLCMSSVNLAIFYINRFAF